MQIFNALKSPSPSAGFETANFRPNANTIITTPPRRRILLVTRLVYKYGIDIEMHLHRSKNYKLFSDPLTYILYDSTDSEFIKFVTYNLRVSHRVMPAAVNIRRMFNTEFIGMFIDLSPYKIY
jgi:hypothetical protein